MNIKKKVVCGMVVCLLKFLGKKKLKTNHREGFSHATVF